MTTIVERRYPESGFVLVDVGSKIRERRMLYAPASTALREPGLSKENEPLILTEGNWGPLTTRQRMECRAALMREFPNRDVILGD